MNKHILFYEGNHSKIITENQYDHLQQTLLRSRKFFSIKEGKEEVNLPISKITELRKEFDKE